MIDKMQEEDHEGYFANPVSDSDAPGYSDVVLEPMDYQTIRWNTTWLFRFVCMSA